MGMFSDYKYFFPLLKKINKKLQIKISNQGINNSANYSKQISILFIFH